MSDCQPRQLLIEVLIWKCEEIKHIIPFRQIKLSDK
jgi:uncharacterized protein YjfI (DUF2170 family)